MRIISLPTAAFASFFFVVSPGTAGTDFYRLSLRGDPATSIVIGWRQSGGADPKVYYGTVDQGTNYASYPSNAAPARQVTVQGMDTRFVRLSGLTPNTNYYFVVRDSDGSSPRFWFRTAPNTQQPFTLVAGGDSRTNRTPRQQGNKLVAKLRPSFVAFGGDYTESNTNVQWAEWLTDWQLTISPDGRMYPIVAARGNHDDNATVEALFDTPSTDVYYALTFGGSLLRLYTLNSEITAGGSQQSWLASDLAAHSTVWKVAQYHRPMFPHTSQKADNVMLYDAWSALFYNHRMNLVVECDSHLVKRTWPLRPSTESGSQLGYMRDDATGTVFIGEGCWGAPLRTNDDNKTWTRASGRFNQFDWIHVYPNQMEIQTVLFDNVDAVGSVADSAPFAPPTNLKVWNAANGSTLIVPATPVQIASFRDGTNGYTASRDTQISSASPATNYGTSGTIGSDGDPAQAALIKWDISSIPAGKEVIAAWLDLYVSNASPDAYEIFSLKRNWLETAATWNQYSPSALWQLAGAGGAEDYDSIVLGEVLAKAIGFSSASFNQDGISLLQSWVNAPSANFGLIFLNHATTDGIALSSREGQNLTQRPMLTVIYKTGTTVSFQEGVNGYTGTRDAKLKSDNPVLNYGASSSLELDGSPDYAGLLKWDLTAIPAGKVVKSVHLNFTVIDTSYDSYELYAVLRDWNEAEVTWNQCAAGSNWQTPGASGSGDCANTSLGSMVASVSPIASVGEKVLFLNAQGTAQVQNWINSPATNFGFILRDYSTTDGVDIVSSEGTAISQRPKITITYE